MTEEVSKQLFAKAEMALDCGQVMDGVDPRDILRLRPPTGSYVSFEDWFHELEGFSLRSERIETDIAWLRAAFDAGRSPTEARGGPVAWKFEHRDFGEVLSLHPMTDGDRSLGWVDTPLYASHPPAREAVDVTEAMVKAAALSLAEGLDGPYPDDKAWIEYQGFARAALVAALQVKP